MTTPAISVNEYGSNKNRVITRNADGSLYSDINYASQGWNIRQNRPASGTSPIRSDKTRAPRAWTHQRMTQWAPVGDVSWLTTATGRTSNSSGSLRTANINYAIVGTGNFPQAMLDRALLKALLRLKDSKIDISVMAAEARRTAGLLGKFAEDMAKVMNLLETDAPTRVQKSRLRQVGKLANWKQIPGRYLEWCYGVTPLLQDIEGSMQKIAEAQTLHRPLRLKVTGTINETDEILIDGGVSIANAVSKPVWDWKCRRQRIVHYSLCYDVPSWVLKDVSELGLSNPVSTLYELMPYSFVLDWVVPVGDWLSVLDAGNYLDFKEGSLTRMVKLDQSSLSFDPSKNGGIQLGVSRLSSQSARGFGLYRSVITSKPVFAGIPRLKRPFKLDKLAKGLALLTQFFSRRG